ncbi:MAG TPA: metallophosphoesterase [Verrucomicrobiae bacterium]|nr:metallophosphoesterase [Verrucomicrobiae bacterium]
MGLRFDLKSANWLAYLLQPGAPIPRLDQASEEKETLRLFFGKLRHNFYSSPKSQFDFRQRAERALMLLDHLERELENDQIPVLVQDVLASFRGYFTGRAWTALLIPSGRDETIDQLLCSQAFLQQLVGIRPEDPGLILQLEDPPGAVFALTDVFPAFRTALAKSTHWPGILLWTQRGDSVFLELPKRVGQAELCARWVFSHLATIVGLDLELLEAQYHREFPDITRDRPTRLNIIQISDIHIGSNEAKRRLPRAASLIRNLVPEFGNERLAIIVSGDLMDTPSEDNLDAVRWFMDFLSNLGTDSPITILGNHDVRDDGYLDESLRMAIRIPTMGGRVVWYDDCRIGIACFSSVIAGHLARGHIGERQMIDIGNEIERKQDWKSYSMLGLLHHHPIPVVKPAWRVQPFYERVLGSVFEKTVALKDAKAFLEFAEQRRMAAVLHGHKHIPRIDFHGDKRLPIIGCGSTVGKVATVNAGTYMSINVISCDTTRRRLSARLLAERIPGGGLVQEKTHEIVMLNELP